MPVVNTVLRHPVVARSASGRTGRIRSVITFDGLDQGGAFATTPETIFTVTGRVLVHWLTAYCTVLLASAGGGTLALGGAGDTDGFIAATTATDIDADEWWTAAAPAVGMKSPLEVFTGGLVTGQGKKLVNQDIILTIGTADVTAGVIIIDCEYTPITDNGRLS